MAQWDNYSQKSTPADTDTLMLKDNAATGKPNKRLLFSGLWTWIVDKLTNATINALQTTTKTVVGGVNNLQEAVTTLNSKTTVITLPTTDVTSSNAIYALYDARSNGESFRQRITTPNPSFDGLPAGNCVLEGYKNSANYGWLRLTTYGEPYGTVFSNVKINGTWSGWKLVPTRDEITALNSNFIITNSVDDLCTKVAALPFNVNATIYTDTNATKFLTQNAFSYSAKGFVARVSSTLADAYIVAYPDTCFSVRFDFQNKTITSCTKLPTRAEMNALDARVTALENS